MNSRIEQQAIGLGDEYSIYDLHGRADVGALVDALGGHVDVEFDPSDRSESLHVRSKNDFVIVLPSNTSVVRDRFTIAHEIGHLILHYKASGEASFNRYGRNRQEAEANAFAAALLMPAAQFAKAYADLDGNISAVADRFSVSQSSAIVRAQVLKLT